MALRCKGCGSGEHVKNGFMRGKQRYRCKACGLNFTDTPPRGMPLRVEVEAVLLYLSGLSMNRTAKLLGVSTPSVQAWIERFAEVYAQKPEPEGRAVVVELDEMWHSLPRIPHLGSAGRPERRGNAGETAESYFHPSRPSGFGRLTQHKRLGLNRKSAHGAGSWPIHLGNPGLISSSPLHGRRLLPRPSA